MVPIQHLLNVDQPPVPPKPTVVTAKPETCSVLSPVTDTPPLAPNHLPLPVLTPLAGESSLYYRALSQQGGLLHSFGRLGTPPRSYLSSNGTDPTKLLFDAIDRVQQVSALSHIGPPASSPVSTASTNHNSYLSGLSSSSPDTQKPVSPTSVFPSTRRIFQGRIESDGNSPGKGRPRKGPWRPDETELLADLVQKFGACNWASIAAKIPGRNGKQARERWKNHLDPRLKKTKWTKAEDALLYHYYTRLGSKWSAIARKLPGRSDNDVKNRFNGAIRPRIDAGNPPVMQAPSFTSQPQPRAPPTVSVQNPPDMFNIYY